MIHLAHAGRVVETGAALIACALVVAGCSGSRPVVALADRVRAANSPLVVRISLNESNLISQAFEGDYDRLRVYLREDASDTQILTFWCSVIVPGGGASMPENTLVIKFENETLPRPAPDACTVSPSPMAS